MQAGRSLTTAQSFGSIQHSINVRPQQIVNVDAHAFAKALGVPHDIEAGFGFRTTDAGFSGVAGQRDSRIENSPNKSQLAMEMPSAVE